MGPNHITNSILSHNCGIKRMFMLTGTLIDIYIMGLMRNVKEFPHISVGVVFISPMESRFPSSKMLAARLDKFVLKLTVTASHPNIYITCIIYLFRNYTYTMNVAVFHSVSGSELIPFSVQTSLREMIMLIYRYKPNARSQGHVLEFVKWSMLKTHFRR